MPAKVPWQAGGGSVADVGVAVAVMAGMLYFASPCSWPLYPAYLSVLAGGPLAGVPAVRVVGRALAFLAGFAAVFVALGAAASGIGQLLVAYQPVLQRVSGVLIAALGLHALGLVRLPLPAPPARPGFAGREPGPLAAALAGAGFAFGWTPCVVPVLGSILLLASSSSTVAQGVRLLLAFTAGFAVPFLLLALAACRLAGRLPPAGRWLALVQRAGGYGLLVLGVLVFSGGLARLSAWLFYLVNRG